MPELTEPALLHLVDRAEAGTLLPAEAQQLRAGIRRLTQARRKLAGDVWQLRRQREAHTAELEQLRTAIDRTSSQMDRYNASARERGETSALVNARQVLGLLSLTWPDGTYAAAAPPTEPSTPDCTCGHARSAHWRPGPDTDWQHCRNATHQPGRRAHDRCTCTKYEAVSA